MTSNQERSILQAPVRAAVITISSSVFHGQAEDRSRVPLEGSHLLA